jgi:hypothetical protein
MRLVAERLELDIQLIARELVLLRASGALDEVPWSVVKVGFRWLREQIGKWGALLNHYYDMTRKDVE